MSWGTVFRASFTCLLHRWPSISGHLQYQSSHQGSIDLGGLTVCQASNLSRVWATHEGGPNDLGATFYEPTALPDGYFMLGHYSQPNGKPLAGRVLAVRDEANGAVERPVNYTLVWNSKNSTMKQDGVAYVWLPVPPRGYKALGYIVTATPDMPSLDRVRCVRSIFTRQCAAGEWIWGDGDGGFRIVEGEPVSVGAMAGNDVPVGTFATHNAKDSATVSCLKNSNAVPSGMPNMDQIKTLMASYGPLVYLHPDEQFFPSSVEWFFNGGALLYQRGNEGNPVKIDSAGSNLPQVVKRGDLSTSKAYVHVKPVQGGTATDLAIWLFYPFNGPVKAKVLFFNIHLGKIGSHVGDWEHVTLRINNFDGKLQSVYFSEHSGGRWVDASQVEYGDRNKPVAYASHNGHALYPNAGLVMQGNKQFGIRNDMAKSDFVMDTGANFEIMSADNLGVVEPPWLNYFREWGPKIDYKISYQLNKLKKLLLFKKPKRKYERFLNSLPSEVLGQEGPTGPKAKPSWNGDEA
uniref:Vacuolar protein sorting-associated protein 62 n=1 Tax=Kalanchoe fedtschenkoi TaxID=63787 RepID=A0A7N0T685_KALFE